MVPAKLHWPSAIVAALVTTALLNLAQFRAVEHQMSDWYEAIKVKPGHDLRALVEGHFPSTQQSIALYVQLRDLAPGATVVLAPDVDIPLEQLVGLAAADQVVRSDQPLALTERQAASLAPYVVAAGPNSNLGEYRLAIPEDAEGEEVVVLGGPPVTWVVARSLLDELGVGIGQ